MFRRNKGAEAEDAAEAATEEKAEFDPTAGPWDVSDIDLEDGVERVDLGGLLLAPSPGHELRLQVDEATQEVQSVLIAGRRGRSRAEAVRGPAQRRPVGRDQAADRRGHRPQGRQGRGARRRPRHRARRLGPGAGGRGQDRPSRLSRIVGVNGPRWLLRATFLGSPATNPDEANGLGGRARQRHRPPRQPARWPPVTPCR